VESAMLLDYSKIKVLIVEDNEHARKLLRMILRDMGITQIFTASDGAEALQFLGESEEMINCIISDWNMPHMSGIDLLRQVRSTRSDMPFLMLTARNTKEAVHEAGEAKVTAYLAKPFSPEQLERKVMTLLRKLDGTAQKSIPSWRRM
jgi:DNA-binding response OmpR family regulator